MCPYFTSIPLYRYPLKRYLFTPIRETMSEAEERYNRWHRQTRATVEATIGILKQRFR